MGIFTKWTFFEKPEIALERQFKENHVYPFVEKQLGETNDTSTDAVYVYSVRLKRFYPAVLLCLACFLFIIIWPSAGGDTQFLVFGISGFALSGYIALEYFSVRSVVLDPERKQYSVYRGHMLTAVHHCHNIYVRLKSRGRTHDSYYLVVDGVGLEAPIQLVRDTTNRKKLRHLAHKIAANLTINYFDIHDSSKHHIVRHRKPEQLQDLHSCHDHEE